MFNKVIIAGNLTRDVQVRYTPGGAAVADIGVAMNRTYYTGTGDAREKKEETVFVDVTVWGRQAETCAEYLEKGRRVLVEGRLTQDTWEDKDSGQKRSKLKITAENVTFLGGGNGGGSKPSSESKPSNNENDEVPF